MGPLQYLRTQYDRFRDSLFWLPMATIVAAVLAGWTTTVLGQGVPSQGVPWLISVTPGARSDLLQLLAGSSATVLGLGTSALTITVQLASSQYSPRLVRTFIREPLVRLSISSLLGLFAFTLIALARPLTDTAEATLREDVAATIAVLGGLVALLLLVAMIDRLARAMEAGSVIRRVLDEVHEALDEQVDDVRDHLEPTSDDRAPDHPSFMVQASQDGWLTDVHRDRLLAALPPDSCVALGVEAGRFVLDGYPLMEVWLPQGADRTEELDRQLHDALDVSATRNVRGNVSFGLRKFNDVILRALSPAINDQGTAYEAMTSLAAAVSAILATDLPARNRIDDEGRRLLEPFAPDHAKYVHLAYEQVRHVAAENPAMAVAMLGSLRRVRTVLELAGRDELIELLEEQRDRLVELVEARQYTTTDSERIREAAARVSRRDDPGDATDEPDDVDAGT